MYCGIDTTLFKDIPGVQGILSAAEFLNSSQSQIAGAFIHYASSLVQNYLAKAGSTPELDQAFSALKQTAAIFPAANQKDLEIFGDKLVASASGTFSSDFYRIGYIAYAAISLYGSLPPRILNKISNAQQQMGIDETSAAPYGNNQLSSNGPPLFTPNGPPQFTPNGPPQFTPSVPQQFSSSVPPQSTPNGPPQFTPNGPPQFTPSVPQQFSSSVPPQSTPNGPPQFTPGVPPQFTPNGQSQPNLNMNSSYNQNIPTGAPQFSGSVNNKQKSKENALKLAEIAKDALSSGNPDVAVSSIIAAMNELK